MGGGKGSLVETVKCRVGGPTENIHGNMLCDRRELRKPRRKRRASSRDGDMMYVDT